MEKRFFIVSYTAFRNEKFANQIYGLEANINFEGKFFNHNEFRKQLCQQHNFLYDSIVITNIFEFKSEEDFNEFVKE